jgi:cytochrome c5
MNPRFLGLATTVLLALPAWGANATRNGAEVYDTVCIECHRAGLNGAPRVGDREAWIPRMKRGLNELTLSAIRGHGGMPARGGQASLTDAEIHNAIAYMFNPNYVAPAAVAPGTAGPKRSANEVTVDGVEIHLGLMAADRLRSAAQGSAEAVMHGGVPKGSGYYHVNISLFDAATRVSLWNAAVEVEVEQPGAATQRKDLEPMAINNVPGYGQYLLLAPRTPSTFTVRIRRPGVERTTVARLTPQPE